MHSTLVQLQVYKYNMTTHFQDRHSNSVLPDAFKISSVEKSRVLKAGKFEKSKSSGSGTAVEQV